MQTGLRRWMTDSSMENKNINSHGNMFELTYIFAISCTVSLALTLFTIPLVIFFQDNYQLFETLAYNTYPKLVINLYQEKKWLWMYFGGSLFACFILTFYIARKFTQRTLGPVKKIEHHLHQLLLGNFTKEIEFTDDNADLKTIKINYDYFCRFLRSSTEYELEILKNLNIDQNNRDSLSAWKKLIQIKSAQLGYNHAPELTLVKNSMHEDKNEHSKAEKAS